jgi:hypothetical protein
MKELGLSGKVKKTNRDQPKNEPSSAKMKRVQPKMNRVQPK